MVRIERERYGMSVEECKLLQGILNMALVELKSGGDRKYGPHKGPHRAIGVLRAEMHEMETEIFAEDGNPFQAYTENIQVIAMAIKCARDVTSKALESSQKE